ncbi:hypothetical protein BO78DRAFT_401816 [Aspergillus sclerotiicarbonarius CBS 121057]|uniref:Secreted protein n=1 Tax=Aspergillus sclerotiicarbonarius (strain CBS 121057 / IBT 28362) TaxID=1448318 RepID=A0A319DXE5_ASPSB|nr:hypothetical protein BO78DRAFT_401816 [Aspergillus sclerotiicarbonarius CBS 121057]
MTSITSLSRSLSLSLSCALVSSWTRSSLCSSVSFPEDRERPIFEGFEPRLRPLPGHRAPPEGRVRQGGQQPFRRDVGCKASIAGSSTAPLPHPGAHSMSN